ASHHGENDGSNGLAGERGVGVTRSVLYAGVSVRGSLRAQVIREARKAAVQASRGGTAAHQLTVALCCLTFEVRTEERRLSRGRRDPGVRSRRAALENNRRR